MKTTLRAAFMVALAALLVPFAVAQNYVGTWVDSPATMEVIVGSQDGRTTIRWLTHDSTGAPTYFKSEGDILKDENGRDAFVGTLTKSTAPPPTTLVKSLETDTIVGTMAIVFDTAETATMDYDYTDGVRGRRPSVANRLSGILSLRLRVDTLGLHYTDKVYALWTAAYPFVVTKAGVTKVVNKTSFVNTASDYSYFRCWLAEKPLGDGRVLASCQMTVDPYNRVVLYIDPMRDEMYDYTENVPTDVVWHDVTPVGWLKPGIGSSTKVSDGWYFTTDYATWVLNYQATSTGAVSVVKEGTFTADGTVRLLMTYNN